MTNGFKTPGTVDAASGFYINGIPADTAAVQWRDSHTTVSAPAVMLEGATIAGVSTLAGGQLMITLSVGGVGSAFSGLPVESDTIALGSATALEIDPLFDPVLAAGTLSLSGTSIQGLVTAETARAEGVEGSLQAELASFGTELSSYMSEIDTSLTSLASKISAITISSGGMVYSNITELVIAAGAVFSASSTAATVGTISAGGGGSLYNRPSLSAFSWFNQSASAATEYTNGPLIISGPTVSYNDVRFLGIPVPSGPFSLLAEFDYGFFNWNYIVAGLGILDASGKMWLASIGSNDAGWCTFVSKFNSYSSWNANTARIALMPATRYWQKINYDGTNVSYLISVDGRAWILVFSEAATAFMSNWTKIGFYLDPADNNSNNNGVNTYVSLRNWSLVTGASDQTYTPPD